MIRSFQISDLDRIMEIWLHSNIEAHDFIDSNYWKDHVLMVREMMPQAQISVYESDKQILGFIGLTDDYIAGIFVDNKNRSTGIGKQLLDEAKKKHSSLSLQVYKKNKGAVYFYTREGFSVSIEQIDQDTGETEFTMVWNR